VDTWAKLAGSGLVAGELARRTGRTGDKITGHVNSGTHSIVVTLAAPDPDGLAARATVAAEAFSAMVVREESQGGLSRAAPTVVASGSEPVSQSALERQWAAVLGGVVGLLLGWLGCALARPEWWTRKLAATKASREAGAIAFAAEVDRSLRALFAAARTRLGVLVIGGCVFLVAGYAATGSVVPPLLGVLAAGAAGLLLGDVRWPAVAVLIACITVLPSKLELVKIGPITPTVLELALVFAVATVLMQGRRGRSIFTGPLIVVFVAVAVGCLYGLAHGGEFSLVADAMRALLLLPVGFFVFYRAFSGRVAQLVAVVAVVAAVASLVELAAAFMGWERLLVDERSSVITGVDTTEVARLAAPVLPLWGPLLILLLSGAFPTRPRWRLVLLALPGVVHEAMSFNRSTWAPLMAGVLLVAIARFGSRGVVRRVLAATALGVVTLVAASAGLLGATGLALADRVTSVVSAKALAEDSLADRVRENNAALDTLREHPYLGIGVGIPYGGEIISYDAVHDRTVVEPRPWIHNQYLRTWLMFGVFGLFALGLLMTRVAAAVVAAWRRAAPGTTAVLATGLGLACIAVQSVLQTTLIERSSLLVVALLLALLGLAASWESTAEPQVAQTDAAADGIMTR
jgi:O-antigen ligase